MLLIYFGYGIQTFFLTNVEENSEVTKEKGSSPKLTRHLRKVGTIGLSESIP